MGESKTNGVLVENKTPLTHHELSRAHAKAGFYDSTEKFNDLTHNLPESKAAAVIFATRVALAGGKAYAKSAYHAGMGIMEGAMSQNPNDGRILYELAIKQALEQGQEQQNKGIEAYRQKEALGSSEIGEISKESNKGITEYKNKLENKSNEQVTATESINQANSNIQSQ
jgi:hypothetical protein